MRRFALALPLSSTVFLLAADTAHLRLSDATKVFKEIMATPDKGIPKDLLEKAQCVVIVPGGRKQGPLESFGRGNAVCRQNRANWSGPAGIRVEGASGGIQIGASNADIVMLVMNDRGMSRLLEDKLAPGGEAAVMAGPVGRQTSASGFKTSLEILSWSRSKKLFAGIALHGTQLWPDDDVNKELYGIKLTNKEILTGGRPAPIGMMGSLTAALNRYSMARTANK